MTSPLQNRSYHPSSQESEDLSTRGLRQLSERLGKKNEERFERPSEWIQKHFYVPEPRDPITAEILPPGPIVLAEHQSRIIDEMLSRRADGLYKYTTLVYSAVKKSGKSTITSALTLYMAFHNPFAQVFCLANDGQQALDRLYGPIYKCMLLHKELGGIFSEESPNLGNVTLANHTLIRAVPCDAAGEAGAEPLWSAWSELWGFETPLKRRLWIEMTVPPTKHGRALRIVETYAGYQGSSLLLWQLYSGIVKEEYRHEGFSDLPVYANGRMFAYWDTEPRMAWQLGEMGAEYYAEEARQHTPLEFQRVHRNQWVTPVGAFIQPGQWEACADESVPDLVDPDVPVVVAIDAAVENDCSAIVAVTRHHLFPDTDVSIRDCRIFSPKEGGSILIPIEKTLREWGKKWSIVCVPYDAFQMASMVHNFQQGNITISEAEIIGMSKEEIAAYLKGERNAVLRWYYKFSQQSERAVSDKKLFDMILHKNIHWNPHHIGIAENGDVETLTKHIKQAGASHTKGQFRIQKLSSASKIDAVVALSMAVERCMALNITNRETDQNSIVQQLLKEKITYAQFQIAMRNSNTKRT